MSIYAVFAGGKVFTKSVATTIHHVFGVFFHGPKLKMMRRSAVRVITLVSDYHAIWNWTDVLFIRNPRNNQCLFVACCSF